MRRLRSRFRDALTVLAALASLCGAARAEAQACCAGSGAYLPARLKQDEGELVGLQLRGVDGLGSFDPTGKYYAAPSGDQEVDLEQDFLAAVRVFHRAQLGLTVPVLETRRAAGGLSDFGGGVGDVSLSARYDFLFAAESAHIPGLALTGGITAPTGRAPEDATSPLLTDSTGPGAWQGSLGGSVEQIFGNVVLSLNALLSVSAARTVGPVHEQLGPQLSGLLAAGYVFKNEAAIAVSASTAQSFDATLDGQKLAGSGRGLTTLSLSGGIPVRDAWRVQAALNDDLPILGRNRPAGFGGTFTVVRSWP